MENSALLSSRRAFLRGGLAAGTLALLPGSALATNHRSPSAGGSSRKARNVIFLVADGMNLGTLASAHHLQLQLGKPGCVWMDLYNMKELGAVRALMDTGSANAVVTDSGAAGSAWGIGQRIHNRAINTTPEGHSPEPILLKAKRQGKRTALVTTSRITHATPASFAANVPQRDMEDVIARQYLEREIDILLGGGSRHFDPAVREDGIDLISRFRAKGYTVATTAKDMELAEKGVPLLGLFYSDHIPYFIDRQNFKDRWAAVPTLPAMMKKAISQVAPSSDGFFLQVESARVDHAGHANDAATIIKEYLEFDQCITVALEFQRQVPDTLVIVTTDHGCGGTMINGEGRDYLATNMAIRRLHAVPHSYEHFIQTHRDASNPTVIRADLQGLLPQPGLDADLFEEAVQAVLQHLESKPLWPEALGAIMHRFNRGFAVHFTTQNHTGEMVELSAFGAGKEAISGFIRNDQLHHAVCEVTGIPA